MINEEGDGDLQNQSPKSSESAIENDYLTVKNKSNMTNKNELGEAQNPPKEGIPTEKELNWMLATGQSKKDYQEYWAYYNQFAEEELYIYDQLYDYVVGNEKEVRIGFRLKPGKVDCADKLFTPVQTEPVAFTLETAARILGFRDKGLLYEFLCYLGDVDSSTTREQVELGHYVIKGKLELSATGRYILQGAIRITDKGMIRIETLIELFYPEFTRYYSIKLSNFLNTRNNDK